MKQKEFNQFEYQNNYRREKYDRIEVVLPKGRKEELKKKAKEKGMSMSEYINSVI
jgi:predicted DNA binding CopG/RHH family protein